MMPGVYRTVRYADADPDAPGYRAEWFRRTVTCGFADHGRASMVDSTASNGPSGQNVGCVRDGINTLTVHFDSPWYPPAGGVIGTVSDLFQLPGGTYLVLPDAKRSDLIATTAASMSTAGRIAAEVEVGEVIHLTLRRQGFRAVVIQFSSWLITEFVIALTYGHRCSVVFFRRGRSPYGRFLLRHKNSAVSLVKHYVFICCKRRYCLTLLIEACSYAEAPNRWA